MCRLAQQGVEKCSHRACLTTDLRVTESYKRGAQSRTRHLRKWRCQYAYQLLATQPKTFSPEYRPSSPVQKGFLPAAETFSMLTPGKTAQTYLIANAVCGIRSVLYCNCLNKRTGQEDMNTKHREIVVLNIIRILVVGPSTFRPFLIT